MMRYEGGRMKLSVYTVLLVHRWLGRNKMTNTSHQCMTFLWTILWSDIQVISPTKICMCIDASINVWGCIQSHVKPQPKLCIQLKFLIKKALLLQVTSLGCHHVDVGAWVWVDSQHFGIYKSESLVKDDESFEEWTYNELHNDEFTTIEFRFRLCLFEKERRHKIGARFIVFKRL